MKKTLVLVISCVLLISCSNSNPKESASANSYNTEKPTTFAEYKKWRQENDPAAKRYAEYKEWEINYRQWQAQQGQ